MKKWRWSEFQMNSFVALSDIHFNLQNMEPASQVLRQALALAKTEGVPLFIGGDVNDTKAVLRAETVESILKLFREFNDVRVVILIGNHDLLNHNGTRHSLEFLKLLENVEIVDEPRILGRWGLIPYIHNKEEFIKRLDGMRTCGIKKLLIHQGVQGALMSEYAFDESSVTLADFEGFDYIFSGHYHKWQWVGDKFMYWGSPFTTRFDEADQRKYIHQVYAVDDVVKLHSVETDVRRHVQIEFEDELKQVDKLDPRSLVKVILRGEKAFVTAITKKQLQDLLGVDNITIVPSITKKLSYRMSVDAGTKPQQVMMDFVDKAETQISKDKLKEYIAKML
jgi:DNA repair exonuclease SbcCD nuclease subunit